MNDMAWNQLSKPLTVNAGDSLKITETSVIQLRDGVEIDRAEYCGKSTNLTTYTAAMSHPATIGAARSKGDE